MASFLFLDFLFIFLCSNVHTPRFLLSLKVLDQNVKFLQCRQTFSLPISPSNLRNARRNVMILLPTKSSHWGSEFTVYSLKQKFLKQVVWKKWVSSTTSETFNKNSKKNLISWNCSLKISIISEKKDKINLNFWKFSTNKNYTRNAKEPNSANEDNKSRHTVI